jgi:hypothetical protein
MTGGASAGLVAAVGEGVVVGATGAGDVLGEATAVPVVEDTRLDFVLLWPIAGIVAVAARRMKLAGRSFICSPLGQRRVRDFQQSPKQNLQRASNCRHATIPAMDSGRKLQPPA